jgi:hypothetical protein
MGGEFKPEVQLRCRMFAPGLLEMNNGKDRGGCQDRHDTPAPLANAQNDPAKECFFNEGNRYRSGAFCQIAPVNCAEAGVNIDARATRHSEQNCRREGMPEREHPGPTGELGARRKSAMLRTW